MNFICEWEKEREKSWSGTHFSLYKNLNSYNEIVDYSLSFNFFQKLFMNLIKLIYILVNKKGFRKYEILFLEKRLSKLLSKTDSTINFMFEDYLNQNLSNSYIYIDLSVSYLYKMYLDKNELLKYTPLKQNVAKSELSFRVDHSKKFESNCKAIFTMSKWLAEFLKEQDHIEKGKVHFVGGGCNMNIHKIESSRKKGNKFLFVGVDWIRKNGPIVVEAFEKLNIKYPNIELYIAGPKKLNPFNNPNIHFLGNLDHDSLADYFNLCDYFVMPSKFEAYGLVFAEALIFGLPCIGRDAFAMPEFIEDRKNGILVKEETVDEIYQSMEELYENSESYKDYVFQRREDYIDEYSWDKVSMRIKKIIEMN